MESLLRIGKFRLAEPIGNGGFATVYKCRNDDGEFAMKIGDDDITDDYDKHGGEVGNMPHMDEWRAYKALSYGRGRSLRKGIPQVYETGVARLPNGELRPYLVMQLLGRSLNCSAARLSKDRIFELGHSMLDIIEHFHSSGYVHRDIKPGNFCFGRSGDENEPSLYILDLGFACIAPDEVDRSRADFVGTPDYASSASLRGSRQSYRDDMESLGYTILELWLGDLPWYLTKSASIDEAGWTHKTLFNMASKRDTKWKALVKQGTIPSFIASWVAKCRSMAMDHKPDYKVFHQLLNEAKEKLKKAKRKNISSPNGVSDVASTKMASGKLYIMAVRPSHKRSLRRSAGVVARAAAADISSFTVHAAVSMTSYALGLLVAQSLGQLLRVSCATPLISSGLGGLGVALASAAAGKASRCVTMVEKFGPEAMNHPSFWEVKGSDIVVEVLGGQFRNVMPSDLFCPGAFAENSLPARVSAHATTAERTELGETFRRIGCHSCGRRSGDFVGDHIPPTKFTLMADPMAFADRLGIGKPARMLAQMLDIEIKVPSQRFYPQCTGCSSKQSHAVRMNKRTLVFHTGGPRIYHAAGLVVGARAAGDKSHV